MEKYDPKQIEGKWQRDWQEKKVYKTSEDTSKPKKYILDMFPYPSGAGLHVGHPKGYIATDILSRLYRMQGFNVLHPMGWDAFGLPAEQFAIKNKMHPKVAVDQNVATFKEQLSIIGLDYDWSRELNTTDSPYYKWTQWAFLQMFKKGLAFESNEPINWCPSCKTGLANEDLQDGRCERCESEIEQKPLRQWVIRITDYAEALLADLDTLDKWPESVKTSQRNWIGKSEGAEIDFRIKNQELRIKIFTTRPDTLFGVTYIVLAPEHSLVAKLLENQESGITNKEEVQAYIEETKKKSPLDRQKGEKTGVVLQGVFAVNPANGEEVPVWIADYISVDSGIDAEMAVPAHDERDFEFAKKYNLPIKQVIVPEYCESFFLNDSFNSDFREVCKIKGWGFQNYETWGLKVFFNKSLLSDFIETAQKFLKEGPWYFEITGFSFFVCFKDAIFDARAIDEEKIIEYAKSKEIPLEQLDWNKTGVWHPILEEGNLINSNNFCGLTSEQAKTKITEFVGGKMKTTYKLKDWVFSRQRYWGEPIPLVHAEGKVYPIPESDLPLKLPEVENYEPSDSGESPLADMPEWVNVRGFVNDKGEFVVAENSPNGEEIIEGRRETNTMPQWAGSCWYYLRYIDPNNNNELVSKNLEQYFQPVDVYVGGMEHATRHLIYARFWHKFLFDIGVVSTSEPFLELHAPGLILAEDGRKMSKRWGNVVNPDDMIERFGADAFRLYQAFMGPFDDAIAWNTDGLVGTRRFIERVVRLSENFVEQEKEIITRELHKLIKKVENDVQAFKFNTCVSSMMGFVNLIEKEGGVSKQTFKQFLQILAPFAPHITEELWRSFGNESSIHLSGWPKFDISKLAEEEVKIVVQINGKTRGICMAPFDASQSEVSQIAQNSDFAQKHLEGTIQKVIFVPNKIINFIVK